MAESIPWDALAYLVENGPLDSHDGLSRRALQTLKLHRYARRNAQGEWIATPEGRARYERGPQAFDTGAAAETTGA